MRFSNERESLYQSAILVQVHNDIKYYLLQNLFHLLHNLIFRLLLILLILSYLTIRNLYNNRKFILIQILSTPRVLILLYHDAVKGLEKPLFDFAKTYAIYH